MAILVDCGCGKKLKAPDNAAGKRVKCPSCGTIVSVPAPQPAEAMLELAEEEESGGGACPSCGTALANEAVICVSCGLDLRTGRRVGEGEPRAPKPPKKKQKRRTNNLSALGWGTVRTGLTIFYLGFPCMILVPLGGGLLSLLLGCFLGEMVFVIGLILTALGFVVSAVAAVVGAYLCVAVPSASGAKGLIIGAVCAWTPYLLLIFAVMALAATGDLAREINPGGGQRVPGAPVQIPVSMRLAFGGAVLAFGVGNILFLLFLRKVAEYFGDRHVPEAVLKILILWGALFVVGLLEQIVPPNLIRQLAIVFIPLGIFYAVGLLGYLLWYLTLVRNTRDLIHLSRAGSGRSDRYN